MRAKYKDYLYLDEFRYSGFDEVTDYKSKEGRIQIRIRNRQKPPTGLKTKGLADKLIVKRVEWCTRSGLINN